ncbi:MAG TPA: CoA pyrophosphatase [Rhodoblastus sp.]|nr:CoA pyrophosphatase [Rhodoblastus sp.]
MTLAIDAAGRGRLVELCNAFTREEQPTDMQGLKHAAVALVVVDGMNKNDPCLLLTRRSPRLRSHAAQWALPGGRCDKGETPIEAALRELDEELGLKISADDALATLDDYPTRSGYVVTPVVVWGGRIKEITPNPDEVQSVHRAPMTQLSDDSRVEFLSIPESDRPVIRLRVWDSTIHAPTAAFLYQFRELWAGRVTRVAHLEQPVFAWR